jgi:hypothetical protein
VIPKWLGALLPKATATNMSLYQSVAHRGTQRAQWGDGHVKRWSGRVYDQTTKVCSSCNNQWMSQLETRADPWIRQLIRGAPEHLPTEGIDAVAMWAVVRATVIDLLERQSSVVSSTYRRALIDATEPPLGTIVWAGFSPVDEVGRWKAHAMTFLGSADASGLSLPYTASQCLIQVGHLVLLVTMTSSPEELRVDPAAYPHLDTGLVRLWPHGPDAMPLPQLAETYEQAVDGMLESQGPPDVVVLPFS